MDTQASPGRSRWRGITGAITAVVVVGALATLFIHNATPGDPGGRTAPLNSTQAAGQLPVVAPSDTRVVYRVLNNAPQRSGDAGATYTALAMPQTDISPIQDEWMTVSPLDASHVFLTLTGAKNGTYCPPPATSLSSGASGPFIGAALSGVGGCSEQYYSANSGATWSRVNLPDGDVFGAISGFRLAPGMAEASAYVFQAQGARLYAGAGPYVERGSLLQAPGARLFMSDDGGATWSPVDRGVASQGLNICDFAVAPSGMTIYVVVDMTDCVSDIQAGKWLYRSDNSGESWAKVGALPSVAEGGMLVAPSGALYVFAPEMTSGSNSWTRTQTAQYALASLDKGVSFANAPTNGIDPQASLLGPVAVLSDSSAVYVGSTGVYAWKAGDAAWVTLSSLPQGDSLVSLIATPAAGGGDTLTMTSATGSITSVHIQE